MRKKKQKTKKWKEKKEKTTKALLYQPDGCRPDFLEDHRDLGSSGPQLHSFGLFFNFFYIPQMGLWNWPIGSRWLFLFFPVYGVFARSLVRCCVRVVYVLSVFSFVLFSTLLETSNVSGLWRHYSDCGCCTIELSRSVNVLFLSLELVFKSSDLKSHHCSTSCLAMERWRWGAVVLQWEINKNTPNLCNSSFMWLGWRPSTRFFFLAIAAQRPLLRILAISYHRHVRDLDRLECWIIPEKWRNTVGRSLWPRFWKFSGYEKKALFIHSIIQRFEDLGIPRRRARSWAPFHGPSS